MSKRRAFHPQTIMQVLIVGGLLISSGCVYLATIPVAAVVGGAELALKGGDLYKEMKKADARQAFDIPFEAIWEITLDALQDLRIKLGKAGKNKAGDGGLIEARVHENKVRIAVVKMTDLTSEVGIWVKGDKTFAELVMKKIEEGTCNCFYPKRKGALLLTGSWDFSRISSSLSIHPKHINTIPTLYRNQNIFIEISLKEGVR